MATQKKFIADLGFETPSDLTVNGDATFDGNATVTGNLTVNGTSTTVNSTTTSVTDSMIELANSNTSSDTLDIGIYGNYDDGLSDGGASEYTGLFRDASDSTWKLFDGLEVEPTTTVNTSGTGYAKAALEVGDLSCTTLTATNSMTGASLSYPTSDGSADQVIKTDGNGTLSFTTISGYTDSDVETYLDGGTSTPTFSSATVTSTINIDSAASAGLVLDRASSSYGSTVDFKTGGTLKWYMGLRGLANDNFYVRNEAGSTDALTIDTSGRLLVGSASNSSRGGTATKALIKLASGEAYVDIQASSTSTSGGLLFSDGNTGNYGLLDYSHASDAMLFYTAAAERMRIDSGGAVRINSTSTQDTKLFVEYSTATANVGAAIISNPNASASRAMTVNIGANASLIVFDKSFGSVGSITTNGSSVAYNTTSDYRLKENVVEMDGAIDRVKLLQPKRFNFIADETDTTVDGFLAHEVQDIIPEAVYGTKDEVDEEGNAVYQGIDQSKLIPLLTKAIQEQQIIIEDLRTRIETLENA